MRKEAVNPDMNIIKSKVPNPSPPKEIKKSGGREDINPDMDLSKSSVSPEDNTGGKVDTGKREQVNPDMDLTKGPATSKPIADEQAAATMPGVGQKPTGKKAANKVEVGQG